MDEKDHLLIIGSCAVIILSVFALILMGFGSGNRTNPRLSNEKEILGLVSGVRISDKEDENKMMQDVLIYNLNSGQYEVFLYNLMSLCQAASASTSQDNLVRAHELTLKSIQEDGIKFTPLASPSANIWECL